MGQFVSEACCWKRKRSWARVSPRLATAVILRLRRRWQRKRQWITLEMSAKVRGILLQWALFLQFSWGNASWPYRTRSPLTFLNSFLDNENTNSSALWLWLGFLLGTVQIYPSLPLSTVYSIFCTCLPFLLFSACIIGSLACDFHYLTISFFLLNQHSTPT